jgi:oligoendopeptidase F
MDTEKNLPRWDLSDLYAGPDDPKIAEVSQKAIAEAAALATAYRGRIAELNATELKGALVAIETVMNEAVKPIEYAMLCHAADTGNARFGALLAAAQRDFTEVVKHLTFFELELVAMPPERLEAHIAEETLANYRNYLCQARRGGAHRLSEPMEKVIMDKDRNGLQALIRLFDEELAAMEVPLELDGETVSLNESKALDLLLDHDRARRQAAAKGFTEALHDQTRRLALIVNSLIDDKAAEDDLRHYPNPEEERHQLNQTTKEEVDAMVTAVTAAYGMVGDYYHFKREVLGLPELMDYDRRAPIAEPKGKISWDEAKATVLEAYRAFSPEMADLAQQFFDHGWIDAPAADGKQGGAFCTYVTRDLHPYVLVNFSGRLNDVMTLAHELGHGVNGCLMRRQTPLNFDHPLTLAETASVFGEMLVFEELKSRLEGEERLALIMSKIEEIFATIFRQVSMFRFERELHAARRQEGELAPERIDQLWRQTQVEMYGDSVTLTADYDRWWLYVTHFWHTPFYVYAYAYGELLTLALYAKYRAEGPAFTAKYLEFLAAGSSATPAELVKPFGIDLADPAFWQGGLAMVADLVAEAKALRASLKK